MHCKCERIKLLVLQRQTRRESNNVLRESVNYLTVQDVLWINLQVTGKVNRFSYARLEEATYYQYAYGESNHIPAQVARFVPGFLKMKPLDEANKVTAFVAAVTFLEMNHFHVDLNDKAAVDWFNDLADKTTQQKALDKLKHDKGHHDHAESVKVVAESVMSRFPKSISTLLGA